MKWKVWSNDARQAFLQSESNISRNVYARLSRELREHFSGYVRNLVKPLYGLKESGSYWIDTYIKAFVNKLKMVAAFWDPCFLYRHVNNATDGLTAMLVDDSLFTGTENFAEAETEMHQQFDIDSFFSQ
jgi:hypothetical protein